MKVKEILNLEVEELKKIMSDEEFNRMIYLKIEAWELLDSLKESARLSGQDEDEEHITISAYLDYLEDIKN